MVSKDRQKVGRNDACFCGSGKKYKKCCALLTENNKILDFEWRKIRQTEGIIIDKHLVPYLANEFPKNITNEAWSEFIPEEALPEEAYEALWHNMFIPWLFFNWIPYPETTAEKLIGNQPIALKYLEDNGSKLSDYERKFIETMGKSYYSFYVILEVQSEKYLYLKDIFLKTEHKVKERQGTHFLNRGDIVFARILTLDNQSVCVGLAPYVIDSNYYSKLLDYRTELEADNHHEALTSMLLREEYDWELLDIFFEILLERFEQRLPVIHNTDGDLFELCKVHYTLKLSPEETLKKLLPLTLSKNPDQFLKEGECDSSGHIIRLEIPWLKKGNKRHKEWDNTLMGNIVITKNKLTVEVNSQRRAKQIQGLLKKYLKEEIGEAKILIEPIESKLSSRINGLQKRSGADDSDNINELPEVQAALKEMSKKHWKNWFNEPIPALKNETPREAAKTKAGRERLEALLLHYERSSLKNNNSNIFNPDVDDLRKKLGLPEP
jgi:hypothetical protein